MNKGFIQENEIYIVKCKEIYIAPEVRINTNRTYNLKAFNDLDRAKEYFDEAFNDKIEDLTKDHVFRRTDYDMIKEEGEETKEGYILRMRKIRLVGGKRGNSQTITLTFIIEPIKMQ